MPLYEYQCRDCGEQFEELVNSGSPAIACPKCLSGNTMKLLSAAATISSHGESSASTACPCGRDNPCS